MKPYRIALLVLLPIIFSACHSKTSTLMPSQESRAAKPQTLTWIHHFEEEGARKWLDTGTQLFAKKHPEYSFGLMGVDGGAYMNLLRARAISDNMPDIYMLDSISYAKDLIHTGHAMDLTGQPFLSQIDEKYLNGVKTEDGKIWALPIDVNGVGVIYNKDAFAKAGIRTVPSTWSAFLETCDKLKKAGIIPIAAGYKDSWTLSWDIAGDLMAKQFISGQNWISNVETGKTTFADDQVHFKDVLKRFGERLAYINDKPFETDWNQAQQMLAEGKAGMILNGTWTIDGVKSKNPASNLGLFAFPNSENPEDAKFGLKSTGGIVINPNSPHKEAALQVLELFASQEMGNVFQKDKKALSVIKGLPTDFDPTYIELDQQYIKTERVYDWSPYTNDFSNQDLFRTYMDALTKFVIDRDHNVDRCIQELDQAFDRIRKRAK
ncbi:ABC transporter substrate-binding protein [Paenibacillus sedimenti]|uniref:Carbohydrate ABC transporter substrate-binding protein n=1 Tax=Paenibacillus sedimenti TaxID=2770274 RepID=A0A926QGY0_9BACL|nr:ABC transporter substrate-binding protein [Paenibacillus sedimenti]MBD0378926.1 carbohydrate ABC transporter substrate-binding protein [Paenibacillus sedimenti]